MVAIPRCFLETKKKSSREVRHNFHYLMLQTNTLSYRNNNLVKLQYRLAHLPCAASCVSSSSSPTRTWHIHLKHGVGACCAPSASCGGSIDHCLCCLTTWNTTLPHDHIGERWGFDMLVQVVSMHGGGCAAEVSPIPSLSFPWSRHWAPPRSSATVLILRKSST
jgi:hypothetical protein